MDDEWVVVANSGRSALIERDGVHHVIRKPPKIRTDEFVAMFPSNQRFGEVLLRVMLHRLKHPLPKSP